MDVSKSLITLTQVRARNISDALQQGQISNAIHVLLSLDAADVADVFNELPKSDIDQLATQALKALNPEFLLELDENIREELLSKITIVSLAHALSALKTSDAISIIEDMSPAQQRALLNVFNTKTRDSISIGLSYPEDSVGRIAETQYFALPASWTISKARSVLASWSGSPAYIILLDKYSKPEVALHISKFAIHNDDSIELHHLEVEQLHKLQIDTDKEDAAFLFRRYKIKIAAIVDLHGRLCGILTPETLLQVEYEEAEEDILNLTGAGITDTNAYVYQIAFDRVRYLLVAIIGAICASIVTSTCLSVWRQHESFIIMAPMISAIGGAAIAQTGGVTIRAISNRHLSIDNLTKVLQKEFFVSCITGLILSLVVSARYFMLVKVSTHPYIGLVNACGIILLIIWSGFAGIVLPFITSKIGLDPATTAGPMLSIITDIVSVVSIFLLAKLFMGI